MELLVPTLAFAPGREETAPPSRAAVEVAVPLAGLPAAIHFSRLWPPFHMRVVKPSTSTLTPQRSSVRARMSALIAATVIGRPRIEPELSISKVTTVSRNSVSFSIL